MFFLLCAYHHCEAAAPKGGAWAQPELNPKPGAEPQVPQSEAASLKPTQEKKKCCCKPASLGAVCYTAPLQQKLTITMSDVFALKILPLLGCNVFTL